MKWILIYVFLTSRAGASMSAVFDDRQACEQAAAWVKQQGYWPQDNYAKCFPVSSK